MKKIFLILASVGMVMSVCTSMTSCGGDDDPVVGNADGPNSTSGNGNTGGDSNNSTTTGAPSNVEAVDMGLSVKWASCNVGASKPEEYGNYYAWGETTGYNEGKVLFLFQTYKWFDMSSKKITKYVTNSDWGAIDNKTVLELEDDAAHVNWGGGWRMPTKEEYRELKKNCIWTWETQNNVSGYKVTSQKTGKSIFLPAAGVQSLNPEGDEWKELSDHPDPQNLQPYLDFDHTECYGNGYYGGYWLGTLSYTANFGDLMQFSPDKVAHDGFCTVRIWGCSIRAVCQ